MFYFLCTSEHKFQASGSGGKKTHLIRYGFPKSDKHSPKASLKSQSLYFTDIIESS